MKFSVFRCIAELPAYDGVNKGQTNSKRSFAHKNDNPKLNLQVIDFGYY